jgi:hypothetical protein
VRRYVLAPVLAATSVLLAALAVVSVEAAVTSDATALLYAAGLLALAAVAFTSAGGLWAGRSWIAPRQSGGRRLLAGVVAIAAVCGALAALALGAWSVAIAIEEGGDPEAAAFGATLGLGAAGLVLAGLLLGAFATTGRVPRAGALAQSLAAFGVLVASGFFASLVLTAALRGDYP